MFVTCSSYRFAVWIPCLLFFLLTCGVATLAFDRIPLTQDSAAHLFQAKIFNEGRLFAPAPPVPSFFSTQGDMLVIHEGRWFSMYLPGFPALLALFLKFKTEWLLCPLLGSLTLAIWVAYLKRWHHRSVAFVFGILFLSSPFLFLMSSAIMVHVPELFLASAVLYLCRALKEQPSAGTAVLLFLCLSAAMLTRGFSLLPFLLPPLVYLGVPHFRMRNWWIPGSIVLGIFTGVALLGFFQAKTTGDPGLSAYLLEYPGLSYGFGRGYMDQVHTPAMGLENISNNLLGLNQSLTGWYSGSLIFVILLILFTPAPDRWESLFNLSCVALALFYYFSPTQDLVMGPRYFYLLAPVVLLLITKSVFVENLPVPSLLTVSLLLFFASQFAGYLTKYRPSLTSAGYLKREMAAKGNTKTLVFLDPHIPPEYVGWNDPFLNQPVVICLDRKEKNEEAIRAFPGYEPAYFRLEIDFAKRSTQSGYRFFPNPDPNPAGFINFFALTMALQSAQEDPDRDLFDLCYQNFFTAAQSKQELLYLESQGLKQKITGSYRDHFEQGVLHTARLLLLPKLAYETHGIHWMDSMNWKEFQEEFRLSLQFLDASGEIGKAIAGQLRKAARRIDQDNNRDFSTAELRHFFEEKSKILTMVNSLK